MNGITLLALVVLAVGVLVAYRLGAMHGRREPRTTLLPANDAQRTTGAESLQPAPAVDASGMQADATDDERLQVERDHAAELSSLRSALAERDAATSQLREFAAERRLLFGALADARSETARYRQIVVDLENNAPPPLLDGPGSPDDLKLIVGIGPVLERMLQQLGIGTYRQIARWSERDVDEFDARLPEFPGRIRRDGWVTQARELHQSKYGERP